MTKNTPLPGWGPDALLLHQHDVRLWYRWPSTSGLGCLGGHEELGCVIHGTLWYLIGQHGQLLTASVCYHAHLLRYY